MQKERLQQNIAHIKRQIEIACSKVGRSPEEVELVAVTKTVDVDIMQMLLDLGVKNIGENRIQDAKRKYEYLAAGVWHMIGHLQTNKVKIALSLFDIFHSVDSLKLAEKISQLCTKETNILLQVNINEEATKHGFNEDQLWKSISEIVHLENIRVRGLMTMAPFTQDVEICRDCFRQTRILAERLRDKGYIQEEKIELSMGMSNDFPIAIEEGATFVRVGSAIFK